MEKALQLIQEGKLNEFEELIKQALNERAFALISDLKYSGVLQIEGEVEYMDELPDEIDAEDVEVGDDESEDFEYYWVDLGDEETADAAEQVTEAGVPKSKKKRLIVKVSSTGKRVKRIKCPKGYKLSPNKRSCQKITGSEAARKKISSRKMTRTKRAKGSGAVRRANFKRRKALKKRAAFGLKNR